MLPLLNILTIKMNIILLICVCKSFLIFQSSCDPTPEQQQQLVDMHNYYRRQIAFGNAGGQPAAANMLKIVKQIMNNYVYITKYMFNKLM